jgi:tRNA 2-thiouridine synthesizing protein A
MEGQDLEDLWRAARALDLSGLKCPMPVLMAARALRQLQAGEMIVVTVTDPLAPLDLRHMCQKDGQTFLAERKNENGVQLLIRSGPRGSVS